jgi:hypothetical protein
MGQTIQTNAVSPQDTTPRAALNDNGSTVGDPNTPAPHVDMIPASAKPSPAPVRADVEELRVEQLDAEIRAADRKDEESILGFNPPAIRRTSRPSWDKTQNSNRLCSQRARPFALTPDTLPLAWGTECISAELGRISWSIRNTCSQCHTGHFAEMCLSILSS